MTEALPNGTSTQQISFKLTEQLLPSFTHSKGSLLQESSFEYSLSRISIQQHLLEGEEWKECVRTSTASPSKTSSLKASSINTTEASLRQTPRTARARPISSKREKDGERLSRRLSFRIIELNESKGAAIHKDDRKRFWSEQKRQRSLCQMKENMLILPCSRSSTHTVRSKPQKVTPDSTSMLGLKQSLQIRQISLRVDENRQKNYLKRLIQARTNSRHINDALCSSIPLRSLWRPRPPQCIF